MTNKYKLCRVLTNGDTNVQPIDVNGDPYGDILLSYAHDDEINYAIYENLGDDNDEDWDEYEYYGDKFEKARDEYNKLVKEAENPKVWSEELTLLLKAGCITDNERDAIVKRIEELGGKITKEENEGIKRMPYSIQGEERAEFRYINLDIPKDQVAILGGWLNLRPNILRFLLVRADDRRKKNV